MELSSRGLYRGARWVGLAGALALGCSHTLSGSTSQANPLLYPLETLRESQPIVIVTGDMELAIPSQTGHGQRRLPLFNAAKFYVVSRDRLRFRVQIEHKWKDWADVSSWTAVLIVDGVNNYHPDDASLTSNRLVVRMWDQEHHRALRGPARSALRARTPRATSLEPLESVSMFRGRGSFAFHGRDLITEDVKTVTLVLTRAEEQMRFTWQFELAPRAVSVGPVPVDPLRSADRGRATGPARAGARSLSATTPMVATQRKETNAMKIETLMTSPAVTCRTDDTLNAAAELMWERDCGAIPVVDGDGRLTGMITDRDICMAAYTQGRPIQTISVRDAMARQIFSCQADDSVEGAEKIMGEKQVRRIPIVDGEQRPIGLLSLNDLARHAATVRKKNGLDREVTQTLAAICQPTHPKTHGQAQGAQPPAMSQ